MFNKLVSSKTFRFLLLIIPILLCVVGVSDWVLSSTTKTTTADSGIAVCYSTNSKGTTYYTNIDSALKNIYGNGIDDTLYVIPSLNNDDSSSNTHTLVTMKESHTLESTDILTLPYEGETYAQTLDTSSGYPSNYNFADQTDALIATNRKIILRIESGQKLTINGRMNIGGIIGHRGGRLAGATTSSYAEVQLGTSASIVLERNVTGTPTLDLRGYIKPVSDNNNSKLIVNDNCILYQPIVFYDYAGGTITNALKDSTFFPINLFDFPNSHTNVILNYGSLLNAYSSVYVTTGDLMYNTEVTLIGYEASNDGTKTASAGIIKILDGGYIDYKFNSSYFAHTVHSNNYSAEHYINSYTNVNCYGGVTVNDISLTVAAYDITTSGKMFPLSHRLRLNLFEGTYNFHVQLKIMPGSSINIDEGAQVYFNWNTGIIKSSDFPSYFQQRETIFDSWSNYTYYPSDMSDGVLINNGIIYSSNNSSHGLGGFIKTEKANSIINFITKASVSMPILSKLKTGFLGTLPDVTPNNVTYNAQGYISSATNLTNFNGSSTYTSVLDADSNAYWTN